MVGEAAEPFPSAPEAGDHFVRMQKNVMALQDARHFGPIRGGGHDQPACALHRLSREGRDAIRAALEDDLLRLARDPDAEFILADLATSRRFRSVPIMRGDVLKTGKRETPLQVHGGTAE